MPIELLLKPWAAQQIRAIWVSRHSWRVRDRSKEDNLWPLYAVRQQKARACQKSVLNRHPLPPTIQRSPQVLFLFRYKRRRPHPVWRSNKELDLVQPENQELKRYERQPLVRWKDAWVLWVIVQEWFAHETFDARHRFEKITTKQVEWVIIQCSEGEHERQPSNELRRAIIYNDDDGQTWVECSKHWVRDDRERQWFIEAG